MINVCCIISISIEVNSFDLTKKSDKTVVPNKIVFNCVQMVESTRNGTPIGFCSVSGFLQHHTQCPYCHRNDICLFKWYDLSATVCWLFGSAGTQKPQQTIYTKRPKTTCALCQALLNKFYCLFAGCSAVFEASRNVQIHSRAVVITIINFNVDFKRKKWMELNFHIKCKNNWLWTVSAQRRTVNSTHTEWMNECVSVTKNRNQQKTLRNYVNWWKACDINRSWLTENGIVKFSNQFDGFDERSLAKFG